MELFFLLCFLRSAREKDLLTLTTGKNKNDFRKKKLQKNPQDLADNVVIICSIENLDPMGMHTGDSITVAPAQTLTDKVRIFCFGLLSFFEAEKKNP